MKERPIAVDLFAGVGGMSLGFEQAGFDVVAAVEIDPVHAAAHHHNFPQTAVLVKSVAEVTGREIREAAGIGAKAVGVVFGGPPCQGFSLIGHRMLDDPRNHLVRDFVRLVAELDAEAFVLENVRGLTVGRHQEFLGSVVGAFRELGYAVQLPWRILNAMNYGVPQDRQRLFLMGCKAGLALPQYPAPTTGGHGDLFGAGVPACRPSCIDALGDLPDVELLPELLGDDSAPYPFHKDPISEYARELRCVDPGSWHFGYVRKWEPGILTASMRSDHSAVSRRRFRETAEGSIEPVSRFFKLARQGVSNTLRAGTDAARGAFTSPRPIHYQYPRCITVREMARLHGYPDWFRFHVTKWHGARQVGNSVPPPLARAVAGSVLRALGIQPGNPRTPLALGSPRLLRMDMESAARFWNVQVPIRARDRKSGARKRTQAEVEAAQPNAGKARP